MTDQSPKQIRLWFELDTGPTDAQLNLADWVLCWAEGAYRRLGDTEREILYEHARWFLPRTASDLKDGKEEKKTT